MASEQTLRASAEAAWRQYQWKDAIPHYVALLELEYKNHEDLPLEVCWDLIHYSECLLEANEAASAEDDRETAWECLEHARISLEKMPAESVPDTALPQLHELMATIAMKNRDLPEAISQFGSVIRFAEQKPGLSWRIGLNALFMSAVVFQLQAKNQDSREGFTKAIEFLDERIARNSDDPDLSAMTEIRNSLVDRRNEVPN
jgi:hypothetical protein